MAILTTAQWSELEDRIDKLYDLRQKNRPDYMSMTFNVDSSNRAEERHIAVGAMAKMAPWGGKVEYDGYVKGYQKDYRHAKYSTGIQLEDEIFRFQDFKEIKRRTIKAADSVYKTTQYYGASVFNNAFNDSYDGADDVGLCSAAHPYSPSDSTTQSNEDTLDLNITNLETVYNRMVDYKDDRGDIMGVLPNCIICGNYWRKTALQIVGSEKEPFVADNEINVYDGEMKVIYNPWITGKKWFLADGMLMKDALNWYWARRPVPERDSDFDTEVIKFKLVGLFSYGWDNWYWVYGNNPT